MGYISRSAFEDFQACEKFRDRAAQSKSQFGIKFLDDVIGNIIPGEFILIMADSGVGKTDMLFKIAQKNAYRGVRTLLIALESFDGELASRTRFNNLARRFYSEGLHNRFGYIFYDQWIKRKYNFDGIDWLNYEAQAGIEYYEKSDNLTIFYRDEHGFDYSMFDALVNEIPDSYDLILLDHISYFDLRTRDTFREEGFIAKRMKALAEKHYVPIISAAHINKSRERGVLIYDKESIMGSSDIYKNATTIISIAQISQEKLLEFGATVKHPDTQQMTLFRLCKGRYYGSTKQFVAAHAYDLKIGDYQKGYDLFRLKNLDTVLEVPEHKDIPNILRKEYLESWRSNFYAKE